MHLNRLAQWLRIPALALFSILLASCGSGDGEDPVVGGADDTLASGLRLVFENDFGGPAGAPRTAGKAPLTVDNWTAVTGYGPDNDGWFNDEWQLYQNSVDNLYIEDGALVIEARCDTAPVCNKRDGSITSARIMTKDKLEIKYGVIQARIKVPEDPSMWPAFWTLGKEWPDTRWPDVGEIDIMEVLPATSDLQTVHFTTHWAGPNDAPTTAGCSGELGAADPANEIENCLTKTKELDEPLSNDFHVFEVNWNDRVIVGKIDGIIYFSQSIDPATMEEFQSKMFLLLNVAVGGNGVDPSAATVWPQKMLIDWVRVYKADLPSTVTLIAETGRNLEYNRIIQSQEFQGNEVTADLDSTAVPALEGSQVLQVDYTNSKTGNPSGANAGFGGIFFNFNSADATYFTNLVFSIDTSAFPGFDDMSIEVKDTSDTALQVLLSSYTPIAVSGNWETYSIPFSAFAGVDISKILFLGFLNPVNEFDQLISGTLYIDDIRLVNQACAPNASVEFDAINYKPDASLAQLIVNDTCAANSVVPVKVETGTEEIVVGVDLDAAGHGETIFTFVSPVSVCPASDENSTIALSDPLIATYINTYRSPGGTERIDTATATAGIDPNAIATIFVGEPSYIIATDPGQPLAFAIDTDFNVSDFGTGSVFDGNYTLDPAFSPVWSISNAANTAAVFAMFNFSTGFTAGQESINFRVKNMPNNVVVVKFGDNDPDFPVDLTDPNFSTDIGNGWYEVSIPMSNFPTPEAYTYLVIKSEVSAQPVQFLVTDIFLAETLGSVGPECAAPTTAAPTPTEDPADVISLLNSGNVYTNVVVDTWAQFGNAALLETTLDGTDIKRYSNLGFVGIQTESSPVDASGMTNFRIDVWSTEVTQLRVVLVDFLGDGFAGPAGNSEAFVVKPLTAGQWTSIDISLSEFTAAGLASTSDLNQLILAAEVGAGTIFFGNVYYYNDGSGVELITNGGFETGDLTGWNPAIGGGAGMSSITAVDTQDSGSTWSANIIAGQQNNPALSQANLAMGTVNPGDTIDISFDWCGSAADGGEVAFALLSEFGVNAGSTRDEFNRTASPPNVWTRYSTSRTAGGNVDGGISLQFDVVCGGATNCSANVHFDNVSVTRGGGPAPGSASGQSCVGGGGGGPPGGGVTGSVFFDSVPSQWDSSSLSAFDQAIGFSSCTDDDGAGCPSIDWSVVAAADPARGNVIDVAYANSTQFAGLVIGQPATPLDFTEFAGGNIVFDLNVTNNPGGAVFLMKVDCTGCPTDAGQREQNLGVPGAGWQTFSVPVDDLINANGGPTAGGLKIDQVTTGLAVFPAFGQTSGITYQIDNVRWEAAGAVFEDVVANQWDSSSLSAFDQAIGFSSCTDDDGAGCPSIDWSIVAAADPARGNVIDVAYANSTQFAGLVIGQPATPLDFTEFAGGNIVFDLNVTNNPGGAVFLMKVDCTGCPTDAGQREQNLGVPGADWQTFSVPVDDLINANGGPTAGGLKIDQVTTGLAVFPAFGQTSGITYQIDNVRWEAGTGGGGGGGGGGASGTATIDFEAAGFGAGFTWVTFENDDNPVLQVISNPVPGPGNTSATVGAYTARSTGQEFAGFESGPGDFGGYVIDASTRYVKLWVYKTVISDVGMQLAVGAAARPPVRVANTVTNQWQQLTFDFDELIGFGEWQTGEITKIVVFPDWTAGRGENTIYIDNISFEATP